MKTYTKVVIFASFLASLILVISPNITAFTCNKKTVCNEDGFQFEHRICSSEDEEGGAFIVWSGNNNLSDMYFSEYKIYAQKIDSNGKALWKSNGIAVCIESGSQRYPQVCNDGEGGAIIVWSDYRTGSDIYAQRIDADGNLLWNVSGNHVSSGNLLFQAKSDNLGGAIISWSELDPIYFPNDLFAQRIDSNGTIKWGNNGVVICNATESQPVLDFFCDEDGNSFFSWIDYRNTLDSDTVWDNSDIFAQKVDIYGNVQWLLNGTAVCTLNGPQWLPRVCTDEAGGMIINWIDGERYQCFGQRLNSTGEIQWDANGTVLVSSIELAPYAAMMSDGQGGALITVGASEFGLSVLRINSSADIIYFKEFCNNEDEILPLWVQMCNDGEGGAFITWTALVPSTDELDVIAQRIDSKGDHLWALEGKIICDYPGHQFNVQICNNGVGSAIISWERWFTTISSPYDTDVYYTLLGKGEDAIFFGNFYLIFTALFILALIVVTKRYLHQK